MKAIKVVRKRDKSVLAIVAISIVVLAAIGIVVAYSSLRDIWISQCVVTDVTTQATCNDGTMVKADTILDRFGVRNGANLALIDFDAKRQEILRDIPNIRAISVTRHLPNRVEIAVEERCPIVRMGVHGQKSETRRVADAEGVVFTCRRRGTVMLPLIREKPTAITPIGNHLSGRPLAALRLIEAASDAEFAALGILEADVMKKDFIVATLGDYATLKIAWEGMDEPTESSRQNLIRRLRQVFDTVKNPDAAGSDAKVWNATITNYVFADTQEKIQ